MRKIGYRIWVDNEMEDVKMLNLIRETATIASHSGGVEVSYKNNPIMQYTGLKDKNGLTDIYEGDIVEWPYYKKTRRGAVTWGTAGFWIPPYLDRLYRHELMTVIGNIYENPELMKP